MDWNQSQNFLSNIVFAILLTTMILYWISLAFFNQTNLFVKIAKIKIIKLPKIIGLIKYW